jgi:SAM-dependent methyltransferase
MSVPPRLFDRTLHRKRLDRAASTYGAADFLKRRAAEDAAERLESIMRRFPLGIDLSARGGVFSRALAASDAAARVGALIQADLSQAMRPEIVLSEAALPFAPQSLDLAVSLLSLHWTNDLVGALVQIRQALKPDGLFLGALLGGETLTQLRQALLQAEDEVSGGAGPRISPFADGFDGAALLQRAGFALPVSDVDCPLRPSPEVDGGPAGYGRDKRALRPPQTPPHPRRPDAHERDLRRAVRLAGRAHPGALRHHHAYRLGAARKPAAAAAARLCQGAPGRRDRRR